MWLSRLEQLAGLLVILLVLADVFLTVLYVRMGTGIISPRLARAIWAFFRWLADRFPKRRGLVLSFCGPVILVSLLGAWSLGLTFGAALIMHPALGSAIRTSSGETPTDFMAALYAGGSSLSIVGGSDFAPQTDGYRILYLFDSLIGMSTISLTLTYLMQVYTALKQRNALGLKIQLLTAETGDAAELLARLGPRGEFSAGYSNLSDVASDIGLVKEEHHFYPVLFYFRFPEPYYSVSRFSFVALDAATLIRSALDEERHGWLKRAAAVTQLWRVAMVLVTSLEEAFLPDGAPDTRDRPPPGEEERWRRRYRAALRRLREEGIATIADEEKGAERYVALRSRWDGHIAALAPSMAYSQDDIEPVGSRDEASTAGREAGAPCREQPAN